MSLVLPQNVVTRCRETSSELLEYMKANRAEGISNDITLHVDDLSIGANRMVLSCYSTFFEKMFKSKMREQYEPDILLTGVDGKSAVMLIDYMYGGEITIDSDSVVSILAGADYFQMDKVKTFCFEYLMDRITSDTWYDALTAAKLYRSDQLQEQVNLFITNHFNEIIESTDFNALSKIALTSFISNLNRNQVNISLIYQAIINWIKHNEEERKKEFSDVFLPWFQLIELSKLSSNALQNILSDNIIQENLTCVMSVFTLFSKLLQQRERIENESKIIMVGGERCQKVTEIFNCNGIEPKKYPDLPYCVERHCLLKLNNEIFCIGGCHSRDGSFRKVYCMKLNEANTKWREFFPMKENRSGIGAAVFRNHLVVAGGRNGEVHWSSTECFGSTFEKWKYGPPMLQKRCLCAVVVCDDSLFALGGYDGQKYLSSVERLCSLDGEWELVAPMLIPRAAVAAVSLNGYVYAIGGRSDRRNVNSRQKTVERYDPKLNQWSYVCEMNYVRSGACACVLHGQIFVAGGQDLEGNVVQLTECYNPSEDQWRVVKFSWNKNIKLSSYAASIVL